jgi:hypothetical protein
MFVVDLKFVVCLANFNIILLHLGGLEIYYIAINVTYQAIFHP